MEHLLEFVTIFPLGMQDDQCVYSQVRHIILVQSIRRGTIAPQ